VTQISSDANMSRTLRDRASVPIDNEYERAYVEWIGHVIDYVT